MTDLNSSLMPGYAITPRTLYVPCARAGIVALAVGIALASASALSAQESPPTYAPRFDIAPYAGAAIPTGALRDAFDSSLLLGAQGMYSLGSHVDVLGDFDWARPATKLVATDVHADVYQAGLGVEVGTARGSTRRWATRPFADVGAGMRRYNYASSALNDRSRPVGFAAVGTEVAFGRSEIRLAARDNVLSYVAPTGDATHSTRNDIGLTLGVGFHP